MKSKLSKLKLTGDSNNKFARFVIRPDGGLILGKSFGGILKPNRVYQIVEIMDELMIKDVGPSVIDNDDIPGLTWSRTVNDLVENGQHLHTKDEHRILCKVARDCVNKAAFDARVIDAFGDYD